MKRIAVALVIAVTGCAAPSLDKPYLARFHQQPGGFQFVAKGGTWGVYSVDSADAETIRLEWLREYAEQVFHPMVIPSPV